ncbi:MAG: phosphate acyltransferase PlsX [Candidatus Omnitrophota bacterium]|nr:MAG: phosphate acyltransferase PlsX [Candidatus Omnitrophota bacterium]
MRIAVDAMGGDNAPEVVVGGAVAAIKEYKVDVILVGDEARINLLLKEYRHKGNSISVCNAPEIIEMSESAATSVRRKRKSSIVLGLDLVKQGKADAFFSAGNTGAVVCAAALSLGLLPDIERPGIAILTPNLKKSTSLIIDVGANIDPKPKQLLQYGIMGDVYSRYIMNKANPTVGLLNIGEEEAKGTDFVRECHELLQKSRLNFIGNIEGKHIFSGECDVVICDGFVGNVVLKVSEGVSETFMVLLKRYLLNSMLGKIGLLFLIPSFRRLKKDIDYAEYGGAPLLGVNGIVIIGHGRSNLKAVKNAIRVAKEEVERKFNEKVLEAIKG